MMVVPGLKEEPQRERKALFEQWAQGGDAALFRRMPWWESLIRRECGETCEVVIREGECFDEAWRDWLESGHEYGLRDKEYMEKGLNQLLNFVMIYVKRLQ